MQFLISFTFISIDLHLVFNLVSASTAFRTAESWTPICLPKFDNSGYLHAYVTYFEDSCPACLLLLSTDRNSFFELSSCKAKIKEVCFQQFYFICFHINSKNNLNSYHILIFLLVYFTYLFSILLLINFSYHLLLTSRNKIP